MPKHRQHFLFECTISKPRSNFSSDTWTSKSHYCTLTVRLKPRTTTGDKDRKTSVSCQPRTSAKIVPPRTRETRAIKSGAFSLKEDISRHIFFCFGITYPIPSFILSKLRMKEIEKFRRKEKSSTEIID